MKKLDEYLCNIGDDDDFADWVMDMMVLSIGLILVVGTILVLAAQV